MSSAATSRIDLLADAGWRQLSCHAMVLLQAVSGLPVLGGPFRFGAARGGFSQAQRLARQYTDMERL